MATNFFFSEKQIPPPPFFPHLKVKWVIFFDKEMFSLLSQNICFCSLSLSLGRQVYFYTELNYFISSCIRY